MDNFLKRDTAHRLQLVSFFLHRFMKSPVHAEEQLKFLLSKYICLKCYEAMKLEASASHRQLLIAL